MICRQVGDRWGEALAHADLGDASAALCQDDAAIQHYERALALAKEVGNLDGQRRFISSLGALYHRSGEFGRAAKCYEAALHLTHGRVKPTARIPQNDY